MKGEKDEERERERERNEEGRKERDIQAEGWAYRERTENEGAGLTRWVKVQPLFIAAQHNLFLIFQRIIVVNLGCADDKRDEESEE